MEIKNQKLELNHFENIRKEVLKQWPTGENVDLQESFEFHRSLPKSKIMSEKLSRANKEKRTLIQPRAGVALVDDHIDLLNYLRKEGNADLLPTTIDSYTRQNNYEQAKEGIKKSKEENRSMLNGFPAVNHGIEACRNVINSLEVPVQVRHGTPDARLLAEITLAGGFTAFEGGGISYNIPYAKDVSIAQTLKDWQYVDRLVGYYEDNGICINREPFGPLTGTLVPPSISHSVAIIEAVLAAQQGVKNISIGYGQCGNLVQDIAAIRSLKELAHKYLKEYSDLTITTVFHQWMGGFPKDEAQALGVISWGAATAALSQSTKVLTKTPQEAVGVPTKKANVQGLKNTKQMVNMLSNQSFISNGKLNREKEEIKKETNLILDKVLELGEGDLAQGTVRAFEAGTIDIPFAPSNYNANKILPARDKEGAVRFLKTGNLPFTKEVLEFNKEQLNKRGKIENRNPTYQMVVDDIIAVSNGMLVGKPTN